MRKKLRPRIMEISKRLGPLVLATDLVMPNVGRELGQVMDDLYDVAHSGKLSIEGCPCDLCEERRA